jgi:hypothetical protein
MNTNTLFILNRGFVLFYWNNIIWFENHFAKDSIRDRSFMVIHLVCCILLEITLFAFLRVAILIKIVRILINVWARNLLRTGLLLVVLNSFVWFKVLLMMIFKISWCLILACVLTSNNQIILFFVTDCSRIDILSSLTS